MNIGIHLFCYMIWCWRTPDMRWPIYVIMAAVDALEHWQPQNWLGFDNTVSWMISINVLWHENASCITSPLWGKQTLTGGSSYKGPMMRRFWFFLVAEKGVSTNSRVTCDFRPPGYHLTSRILFVMRWPVLRHRDGCQCPGGKWTPRHPHPSAVLTRVISLTNLQYHMEQSTS